VNEPIAIVPLVPAVDPPPPPPPTMTYMPVIDDVNGFVSMIDDVTTRVHGAAMTHIPPEHI
jgi:hypothetical protein